MRYWITYGARFDRVHKETCTYSSYNAFHGRWVNDLDYIKGLSKLDSSQNVLKDCGLCGGRIDRTNTNKTKARNARLEALMGDLNKPRCGAARTRHQPPSRRSNNPFGITRIVNGSMFCELQEGHENDRHAARTKAGSWFEWYPEVKLSYNPADLDKLEDWLRNYGSILWME